jgi:hypothetical protein
MGTLTSSNLNFTCTLLPVINLYELRSVATPKHSKPLMQENYVRIVALAPGLRDVYLYGKTRINSYSSIIELLLLQMLLERFYLSSLSLTPM